LKRSALQPSGNLSSTKTEKKGPGLSNFFDVLKWSK
jgi:hypothetical protein